MNLSFTKMKWSCMVICMICGISIHSIESFAQINLSGYTKYAGTNEPLTGVSIYLNELKTATVSDENGYYKFDNLKKGSYLFELNYVGFKKQVKRIQIVRDTIVDFILEPSVSEFHEVIVTAVSKATELKLSPMMIKPVEMSALNANASTNLIDALKNIPGINQITTGAGISKPIIRGLGYNRVVSMYNGIRQEGQQWGDEHGIEIDEFSIEKIEIVKGPGSLLYGSDGIAGVLNFISTKAPPEGTTKSQLISNYQSNNHLIGNSFSFAGNKKGIQWVGRLSNKMAGNYQNRYDGRVYNSGFREYDGNIFLGLTKKWGYTHFHLSSFNSTFNMVEGERDSLGKFVFDAADGADGIRTVSASPDDLKGYRIGFPHQDIHHLRIQSNNFIILNRGSLNLDLGYQNNKRKEFGSVLFPTEPDLFFDLHTINYSFRYNLEQKRGWETSVGVNGMEQNNENKGKEFIVPAYYLFDAGAFLFTQKSWNKITLAGGIRADRRSIATRKLILNEQEQPVNTEDSTTVVRFNALHKNYMGYSGSIGLSYQMSNTSTWKLNFSKGFRSPNIAEIASNGKHEGTLRYEYGSSTLQTESSYQVDLGYFLNTDHITLEITPFANFISNYIYAKKLKSKNGTDSIPDSSDPTPAFKFDQGNARLLGGEIYFDLHPHPLDWLHIEQSFGYVSATQRAQTDSTKYLPFTPAPHYRGEIRANVSALGKWLTNCYFKIAFDHYFRQDRVYSAYGTETSTPDYSLLSAGIGTHVRVKGNTDAINVFISGENLTDVAYQSHLSRLKYAPVNSLTGRVGVFNMGRNFSLKVIFNF